MKSGRIAAVIVILAVNNAPTIHTSEQHASKSKSKYKNNKNAPENINDVWQNWLQFQEMKDDGVDTKMYKREANRFGLRAERDADDYYDKGGESDSEDYYERKEWSDVFRQAHSHAKPPALKLDHPDLEDIDGVHVKPHHGHHQHKHPIDQKDEGTKIDEKTRETQIEDQHKEKNDKVKKKPSSKRKRDGYSQERASAIDVFNLF